MLPSNGVHLPILKINILKLRALFCFVYALTMKKSLLLLPLIAALSTTSLLAQAADYHVIVPAPGKAAPYAGIKLELNPATLPVGLVGDPFAAFDFQYGAAYYWRSRVGYEPSSLVGLFRCPAVRTIAYQGWQFVWLAYRNRRVRLPGASKIQNQGGLGYL